MADSLSSRPLSEKDLGLDVNKTNKQSRPSRPASKQPGGQQSDEANKKNNPRPARQDYAGGKPSGKPTPNGKPGGRPNGGNRNMRNRFSKPNYMDGNFNSNSKPDQKKPARPVGMSKIDAGKLKVIPLGGLDRIGKNMMAIEYENDIIVVDMGFQFPDDDMPGIDYIIPDTTYLEERKHKIRAHLITHAHEDHVGGIPFILPKLPAPIYGAQFTIKYIEKKLEEHRLPFKPDFRIVDQDREEIIQLGVFKIEFIRITHSIPDACALAIHTPVGTLIHTGDWRFDEQPLDGKPSNVEKLRKLGDAGVLMLMCDSTSCEKVGKSPTEQDIIPTLEDIFIRNYNKRIIISSFASQVNRIQVFIDAIAKSKRKLAVVGRSLLSNLELAIKLGYIKVPAGLIIKAKDIASYQDGEIVILTTGHQGEDNSALVRMSTGEHKDVKLKAGDVVVLSSSIIPGNEKSVFTMVDGLFRHGAYVYQEFTRGFDDLGIMHTSGHAYVDEVKEMIALTRPKYYLPIHGEMHHMFHNGIIAAQAGIAENNIFVIENGQTLVADKSGFKKGPIVQNGSILIDGNGIGDVQAVVLKDRLAMASEGVFTVIATIEKKTGKLKTSPDIISRGFIYMKDNEELLNKSRQIVRNIFEKRDPVVPANSLVVKTRMREELSNYLYKVTKRNPIVLPVVIEV